MLLLQPIHRLLDVWGVLYVTGPSQAWVIVCVKPLAFRSRGARVRVLHQDESV
ncbi:MAG: hypothetical protein ACRER5_16295 [Pseudomonas sp.]